MATQSAEPIGQGYLDVQPIAPRVAGPQGADRGFIAGRSGSGKSYLAREILKVYGKGRPRAYRAHLVIVDPNGLFDFPGARLVERPEEVLPSERHPVILYRPPDERQDRDDWNELMRRLFLAPQRIMLYVDEIFAMEPLFGRKAGTANYLNAYLTRGRARGKGALMVAQRPVNVPRNIIAQAEWFYMFDLPLEDDRITMSGTIGRYDIDGRDTRDRASLGRYEFFFKNPDLRDPVRLILR